MEHAELADILMRRSYLVKGPHEEPFVLSSGKASSHYFDVERTTSYAPALPLIGRAIYEHLRPGVVCVGGPTRGADPIADAVAYYSTTVDHPIHAFSIRRDIKKHGIPGYIEGSAQPGDRVAFVDDVVTSGRSVKEAFEKCHAHQLVIVQVLVMVDREEGGMQVIRDLVGPSIPVEALFTYGDLLELRERQHGSNPSLQGPRSTAEAAFEARYRHRCILQKTVEAVFDDIVEEFGVQGTYKHIFERIDGELGPALMALLEAEVGAASTEEEAVAHVLAEWRRIDPTLAHP